MMRSHAHRARGLTLLELLIAITITSIAGLALSTVMTAVARSLTGVSGARSALQRSHAAFVRLRAYTDPGLCLLQSDPARGFAVWLNDNKPGTTVNLREYRAFWFDAANGLLTSERVEFPAGWSEEMKDSFDVPLSNGSDFLTLMEVQRALGYTATETIADGVSACVLTHVAGSAQTAKVFWLLLTMDDSSQSEPDVLTAYAFLNHVEPR